MKIFKPFLLFAFVALIASCSDDDSTEPIDAETLIGSWTAISLDADIDLNGDFAGIPVVSSTNTVGENLDYNVTFTETEYTVTGGYDLVTTGTVNGEPLDAEPTSISGINETGTYSLDGNTLTIDGNIYDFDANGVSLSEVSAEQIVEVSINSNGELVMRERGEQTLTVEGINFTVDIDAVSVWRRQ
nr:hypothetical protein [Allomuricauda sp.]